MARLFALLMMLALVLTNGAAVMSALCKHVDAHAHATALASTVESIAAEAHREERVAEMGSKEGTVADAAGVQLAGYTVPSSPVIDAPEASASNWAPLRNDPARSGRAIPPLLNPPLA